MNAVARRSYSSIGNTPETAAVQHESVKVSLSDGEVEYKRGSDNWQALASSTLLETGDMVRIVGAGHVALDLKGYGIVRLGSDTAVTLTEVNEQNVRLGHDRGAMYLRLPKDDSEVVVSTPSAQYTFTGTSAVTYAGDGTDGIAVFVGSAQVTSAGVDDQVIATSQSYYVATKDTKSLQVVLPLSDIIVTADTFLQWNATQDRELGMTDDQLGVLGQAATAQSGGALQLTAAATDKGIVLSWRIEGEVDVSKGFKVVQSTSRNPVYPGSSYHTEPQTGTRTHTWELTDGQTYHFRVCQYLADGSCGLYSNNVAITAPLSS